MLKKRTMILVVCCLLLLSACGKPTETPLTQATMDALYTSVAQTLAVSLPSVTPQPTLTPSPTNTNTPLVTNTVALATNTKSAPVSTCDDSVFVADVTIPDNTAMSAGQTFTKTWSIKNVGTCKWDTSYKLVFLKGDAMSGVATNISAEITSGHADNVSVKLVAPTVKGSYTGYWIMQNPAGRTFGASMYVTIIVSTTITATSTGTVTPTPNVIATNVAGTLTSIANSATPTATSTTPPAPTATSTPLPTSTNTPVPATATNTPPPTETPTPTPTFTTVPIVVPT